MILPNRFLSINSFLHAMLVFLMYNETPFKNDTVHLPQNQLDATLLYHSNWPFERWHSNISNVQWFISLAAGRDVQHTSNIPLRMTQYKRHQRKLELFRRGREKNNGLHFISCQEWLLHLMILYIVKFFWLRALAAGELETWHMFVQK